MNSCSCDQDVHPGDGEEECAASPPPAEKTDLLRASEEGSLWINEKSAQGSKFIAVNVITPIPQCE